MPWQSADEKKGDSAQKPAHSLQVIGIGFPRTGTRSLHTALTTLGFSPCHHFQTDVLTAVPPYSFPRKWLRVFQEPDAVARQQIIASIYADGNGSGSFAASVDFPGSLFVEDMFALYPKAKFILTTRDDGAAWKRSFDETIGLVRRPWWRLATALLPSQWTYVQGMGKEWEEQCQKRYGQGIYQLGGSWKAYEGHNAWVRRVIPREQLLESGPNVGWKRLCDFLGIDVPQELGDYPRVNETKAIRRWFVEGAVAGLVVWALWLGAAVALVSRWLR